MFIQFFHHVHITQYSSRFRRTTEPNTAAWISARDATGRVSSRISRNISSSGIVHHRVFEIGLPVDHDVQLPQPGLLGDASRSLQPRDSLLIPGASGAAISPLIIFRAPLVSI